MKTIYEDSQYKILYGSSKKGCMSSRNNTPKIVVIDKQLGQQVNIPSVLNDKIQELINNG